MASSLELAAVEGQRRFNLLPYPRSLSLKGSPMRVTPSGFLYLAGNASSDIRRRAHFFCQQLQELGYRTLVSPGEGLGPTQAIFTASGSFQRSTFFDRPLRGETAKPEGYRLSITADGALMYGADERGLLNATATLRQLVEDNPNVPGMEIEDYPLLPMRALHLDFKGWPPTAEHLRHVLILLAGLKFNAVILEYESFFDFPSQPGLASDGALSAKELGAIELLAQDLGLMLIPLVPCLGNVGHVLRRPAYLPLREHPDYLQQYCPANPMTLEVVTAMMEDLLKIHSGKYFHIGGDEARLLGTNETSKQRAKQLGGRSALYLEYLGKVCRYLLMRERQPLVWDDMFRKMTDEQIKWLPPEVILTVWEYEGLGGRAAPTMLTNLDRYHRLGRPVWGAATRSPASRYDAFDNIDAWTEAAELGYLNGMLVTTWTREHTCGGLYPPPESAWPAVYYAAERLWSGRQGPKRELFPETFIGRFFGVSDRHLQSRLWAACDMLLRDHALLAREYLKADAAKIPRNYQTLPFLEAWAALGAFKEHVRQFEKLISANYANLRRGAADPFHCGRLRWRISEVKKRLPELAQNFSQQAARLTPAGVVQEYLDSSVAYDLQRLEEMEHLLASYPLPSKEWRQPVQL